MIAGIIRDTVHIIENMEIVNGGMMDAHTVQRFHEYIKVESKRFLNEKGIFSPKWNTCTVMAYPSGQQRMERTRLCLILGPVPASTTGSIPTFLNRILIVLKYASDMIFRFQKRL